MLRLLAGAGALALVGFLLVLFGNARFHSGRLSERVAWQAKAAKEALKRAAEREADAARVQTATGSYAARMAALRPTIVHNSEVVHEFAQTPAGRVLCLDVERVRGIEATASALGLPTTPAASDSDAAMRTDTITGSRPD